MKFLIFFVIFPAYFYGQDIKFNLDNIRLVNCKKKCKVFLKELDDKKNNNFSIPSYMLGSPKYSKMFSIKKEDRMKIYPFNKYDSIYITSPNFVKKVEESRNYLEEKYHNSIRILTEDEKIKLSDILFNYHKTYDLFRIGVKNKLGCDCIQLEYPQIILLFMKNGKFEKFIAVPDDGWNRYNFSDKEYQNFDWSMEKESMILEMFKKDILPNQDCKNKN